MIFVRTSVDKAHCSAGQRAAQLHHHGPIAAAMGATARQLSAVRRFEDRPDTLF